MNRRNFLTAALGLSFGGGTAAKALAGVAPLAASASAATAAATPIQGGMIVTAAKIAANSITAEKLVVSRLEDLP